ncbi:MAG: hypothetical protein RSA66_10705, partial [Muribaculaceae bacterium]
SLIALLTPVAAAWRNEFAVALYSAGSSWRVDAAEWLAYMRRNEASITSAEITKPADGDARSSSSPLL